MYHQFLHSTILHSAHTVYLRVLCGSENRQRLFPYTTLTGFYNRDEVCLLRGTDWIFIYNSTFCPHSVFMCFVWIWEQTAIVSLCSINVLVSVTETVCLLRGTDWVYIIKVNLSQVKGRAMAQAVTCRFHTMEGQVQSQISPRQICGAQSGTVTGFSPSTSSVSNFPPLPDTHLHLRLAKPCNLASDVPAQIGEHLIGSANL